MAGYKRFAAKMLLGTTVLASVGAGGYYAATGDRPLTSLLGRSDESRDDATSATPAAEDLDAVAGAWAQPAPAATAPAADPYSPISQTAAALPAVAGATAAQPLPDDPYGAYAGQQAPLDAANQALAPSEPARETSIAEDGALTAASTTSVSAAAEPALASVADEKSGVVTAVARGQEPSENAVEAPAEPPINFDNASPADSAGTAGAVVEPQPLDLPREEQPLRASARRAKQAFGDVKAETGDRYGALNAAPTGSDAAAADSTTVNPFDAATNNGAPTGDAVGSIAPLPPYPAAAVAGRGGAPGNSGANGAGGPNARTARASAAPPANLFEGDAQPLHSNAASPAIDEGAGPSATRSSLAAAGESGAITGTGRPGERTLEGPQNSHLVIQKFAPAEIQVGKPAKFVVQVRNTGNQAAHELVVSDEVPEGTQLVSTSPSAQANGNRLVWQIEKLSAGEERTFEMQLMPMAEGEVGSVATVTYAAQASVKTRCTMPQLAIRMTAPDKVLIGQEQRVKIELRNPGSGDATGVLLFEDVPANLKHAAGPTLEFEIGTLRAGESRTLELVLHAEKAGPVVNTLTARADGNLQAQEAVQFEVIAPALAVEVKGPERRFLERPAKYEVSVQNPGTAPAYDVQIVTKLPKGMRFVKANNMGEYDANSHSVYWSLAELPEGERGTVELVAMPIETGPQTLSVETRGGQGLSDQAQQQVLVEGLAAIQFEVRDLDDPIEVGGETGYEIRVVNQGTKAATNVRVAVNLSNGMQIVSAEGQTQHAAQGGALVFEPLPQLAAKSDALFRVRVRGAEAGDQRVTVEVTTDDLAPIRREESTRVFGDE